MTCRLLAIMFGWLGVLLYGMVAWGTDKLHDVKMIDSDRIRLDIYSIHYAPRGYARFGDTGCGSIFGMSFGQVVQSGQKVDCVSDGTNKCLRVASGAPLSGGHKYDSADLFYDIKSRKLFRIRMVRTFPRPLFDSEQIASAVESLALDIDQMLALKVELNKDKLRSGIEKHDEVHSWAASADDSVFAVRMSLSDRKGDCRLEVEVTNKTVCLMKEGNATLPQDVKVIVEDM